MSLWQFLSALNGAAAQPNRLSEAEVVDLFDWIEARDGPRELSTDTYKLDGDRLVPAGRVSFRVL
jgi:hypothetical protein